MKKIIKITKPVLDEIIEKLKARKEIYEWGAGYATEEAIENKGKVEALDEVISIINEELENL